MHTFLYATIKDQVVKDRHSKLLKSKMLTVKLMNKLNKKEIASAIKQVVDNVSDQIIVLQRTIKKQTKKIEKLQAALAKKE